MDVKLIGYTQEADNILIFSKRTRHMRDPDAYDKVCEMTLTEKMRELEYVFNTISTPLEFVSYTFLICDVTRAFTHQLVRHRVGVSFAQQSMRVGDQTNFKYLTPPAIEPNIEQLNTYEKGMECINFYYEEMLRVGANQQDARGLLPTNIHTNILMKINLRALAEMLHTRLCVRAQGEFQDVAKLMMKKVKLVHPFTEPILGPSCIVKKICKFPRYKYCPVKYKYPWVDGVQGGEVEVLRKEWDSLTATHQQPDISDKAWEKDEV